VKEPPGTATCDSTTASVAERPRNPRRFLLATNWRWWLELLGPGDAKDPRTLIGGENSSGVPGSGRIIEPAWVTPENASGRNLIMRKALTLMALAVLAPAAALAWQSRHEIERYIKISRM
jgi:hypothetical protein